MGNVKLDSANFELKLNGEEINYGSLTITGKKGVDASSISFRNYQVGTNLKLNEGENTFTLTIKSNELFNGEIGRAHV